LFLVVALAALLAGRGLGDESVTPPDGDAPRYMMNGVFLMDAVRDGPFWRPQQALDYARHYYGRYPALSLGHHPFVVPLMEMPVFAALGVSVTSARLVGILSFVTATAFLFLLLHRHHGIAVATLGGALFASNPYLGSQARVVLSEVPTLALVLAAAFFLDRFCRAQRRWDLVALVLTAAASAYSKQLAAALYPAYLIHAALALGPRRLVRRDTVVATLALCLLVTPLVPLTLQWSPGNVNWVAAETARDDTSLADLSSLMGALRTHHPLPVLLLAALGLVVAFQRRHPLRWLLLSWTVCGFAIVALVTREWEPARYGIYSMPALAMLAAGAWTGWSPQAIRSLLVTALVLVIGYQIGVSARKALRWSVLAALLAVTAYQAVSSAQAPLPRAQGFEQAARFVVERPVGATVLYSAEVDTGLFVFFARKHDHARQAIVLRSDKLLTTSYMSFVSVEDRISSREEIDDILRRFGVGYVVLEDRPTPSRALNWLREETRTDRFAERLRIPIVTNEPRLRGTSLAIYEFLDRRDPDPDAVVDMKLPLVGSEVAVRLSDLLSRKYLR